MEAFKFIRQYLKKYAFGYSFCLLVAVIVSLAGIIPPYLSSEIAGKVIINGQTEVLLPILGLMLITMALRIVFKYSYQIYFEYVSQNVLSNIRTGMYEKLGHMDFDFYDKNKVGDLMTRMTGDMEMIRHFTAWTVYVSVEQFIIFTAAMIIMFLTEIKFAVILLMMFPFVIVMALKFFKEVRPAFDEIRHRFSRLNTIVQENVSGNRIVKAFAKEDYEIQKFNEQNDKYRNANLKVAALNRKYIPFIANAGGLLTIYMIVVGGIFVINNQFDIPTLVMLNGMLWMLANPLNMIGGLLNEIQRFNSSAKKVKEIFDIEPKIKTVDKPVQKLWLEGKIEFKNVSFTYENIAALHDVSFVASSGQTVGIIGPTGSGKSTLTSLIGRFYDTDEGEVLIDDINIKYYDVKKLRENISFAHQEIFLFSDTIESNIAYGAPNSSMRDVVRVASKADAHDFIIKMSEGYDTIVGERGVGLSGGQKQRIALARALLKNPAILILDDTTSSVDTETEKYIFDTLKSCYDDCTTFIIAHRISSIINADLILVMEDGKIIECGTHEELTAQNGYYNSVFENQCGDFNNTFVSAGGCN